jgi:hypothetical protein
MRGWLESLFMVSGARQGMNYCWETSLSCIGKSLESRDACGSQFIPIQPCYRTHHIDRRGNAKMLQMRFGKANITGAAHAKGTHPLSEIVASMPSRSAYSLAKAGVCCRRRAA